MNSEAEKSLQQGKYYPLYEALSALPKTAIERTFTFKEISTLLGLPLPKSAFEYREWWSNQSDTSNRPQAKAWIEAGFLVDELRQNGTLSWVRFRRKAVVA